MNLLTLLECYRNKFYSIRRVGFSAQSVQLNSRTTHRANLENKIKNRLHVRLHINCKTCSSILILPQNTVSLAAIIRFLCFFMFCPVQPFWFSSVVHVFLCRREQRVLPTMYPAFEKNPFRRRTDVFTRTTAANINVSM